MSVVARLDAAQQRHAWLGLPLAVGYKFFDDQGGYLAALIAYYGFLSLFPLLLLAVTILGFVLVHNPALREQILTSALAGFPIVGRQVTDDINGYRGSGVALVFGIVGSLFGALGVAQAGQNAMNVVWAVPRYRRPNPIRSRLRSLRLILVLGLGVLATTALSAVSASAQSFAHDLNGVSAGLRVLAFVVAVAMNVVLFVLAFRLLTVKSVAVRDVWVGAAIAGLIWQLLQVVGTWVLGHEIRGATEVYGTFGFVLGLVLWIYIESLVVVFCAELNSVLHGGLWPRALLTPFTDDVQLTAADEQVYDGMATSQQAKGFEQIDVTFDPPDDDGDWDP
jgi:YihY family inner membrane protein